MVLVTNISGAPRGLVEGHGASFRGVVILMPGEARAFALADLHHSLVDGMVEAGEITLAEVEGEAL